MRSAVVEDGRFLVYEDGTIFKIIDGVETKSSIQDGKYLRTMWKSKKYLVHRLIAMVFIPNPGNKPYVNHKDGNKHNNSIDNLEWCTPGENVAHAWKTGLNHGKSFATKKDSTFNSTLVNNIRILCKNKCITLCALERELGIGNGVIARWSKSSPKVDNVKAVADYFGVTVDDLLKQDSA